jgi:long-chain acyl-CoA synthetase
MNLGWGLERSFWEYPDKNAIIDSDGTTTTYAQLRDQANRIANVLARHGAGHDDAVVTAIPDNATHVAILFATLRLGAAFSGLNYKLRVEKLISGVTQCNARFAIFPELACATGSCIGYGK